MIKIRKLKKKIPVYDITVEDNHNFFANNILVHNCTEIGLPSFEYCDYNIKIKKNFKEAMDSLINEMEISGEWFKLYEHLRYGFSFDSDDAKIYKSFLAKPKDIKNNNYTSYNINFYEIFACILSGVNLSTMGMPGNSKTYEKIVRTARKIVRFLDNLIDYQEYPIPAMERAAVKRRALGISFSGLFHYLAKGDLDYGTLEARNEIHRITEALYYGSITESIELAKERGKCHFFNDTKYSDGLLTIDTCNKNVHELTDCDYMYDWDFIREQVKEHGMRNSTLLTMVPASNSARIANTLSGIEPPQNLVIEIEDKRMQGKMLVPDAKRYKKFYEKNNMWNIDMKGYYKAIAIIQKFADQSISINGYYNYTKYKDEVIPFSEILEDDETARKFGIKTHYYNKTKSDNEYEKTNEQEGCDGGGCTL